jgi:opacity protein-like surface antigen
MQRFILTPSLCLCGLILLNVPQRAYAQERNVTVGIAYQYLRLDDESWPRGARADIVFDLSPRWATVAEVDRSWSSAQIFGFDEKTSAFGVSGGPRWTIRATGRVRPYVQVLVGAQRDGVRIEGFGSDARTHFAVQPGAGIAIGLTRRLAAFTEMDWRRLQRDTDNDALHLLVGGRVALR